MTHWLIKSEPFKYSWNDLLKDKQTYWDGVRNYQARNNLQNMKKDDLLLYYHSNEGMEIVGIAKVIKAAYQDPTTEDTRWVAVDVKPVITLNKNVTLKQIKQDAVLSQMQLVRQGRLSVSEVTPEEFDRILTLSETNY